MGCRELESDEGPGNRKGYEAFKGAFVGGPFMKIDKVSPNNRKKAFELVVDGKTLLFPFMLLRLKPEAQNRIKKAFVDPELGNEAFTYSLGDGREDSVHVDEVLEYNRDPNYMRDILLYRLTLEVQKRLKESRLSRREIIRRLGTSASQFYRLLDQTYYEKSVDQMLALLTVLGCQVNVTVEQDKIDGKADLGSQKAANP
jgi:predicted XRE-type DNA-binding protein